MVTKDADFVQSFLIAGKPPKLWLISTGNIANRELEGLIQANHAAVARAFETAKFVELSLDVLTVHE